MLYANVQSVAGKVGELCCVAHELDPDIILLTETWCNDNTPDTLLSVPGYEIVQDLRRDRSDTHHGMGGGLLVFTKPDIKILPLDIGNNFNQYCSFNICNEQDSWTIILVYRPPSSSLENNIMLAELIKNAPTNTILLGDFNLPGIDWEHLTSDSRGRPILEACTQGGLEQLVTFPTHIRGNVLDLVLTDVPEKVRSVTAAGRLGRSDHEIIMIELDTRRPAATQEGTVPDWGKAEWSAMRQRLDAVDWQDRLGGKTAEEAWNSFKTEIEDLIKTHVPVRQKRAAPRPPWLTTDLLRQIRLKRRLWSRYKRSPTDENLMAYKQEERRTNKRIRNAKKQVEKKMANTEDKKEFYKYMRGKTKNKAGIGPIKVDGQTLVEDGDMAEALNDYFASVFQEEDHGPAPQANPRRFRATCNWAKFRPSLVKEKIRKLKPNSAPGPDGITPRMLQQLVDQVACPLSMIFQKSMGEGVAPLDWKSANVTPIHKKGSKTDPGNYRPVSLTSVPGKIMESIIKDHMQDHLKKNRLIRESQHGFMPRKSCTTNLLEFLEKATKILDQGQNLDMAYLDFAKAFDLVPKKRLIEKLKAHGFTGKLLSWIENWLTNRRQRVVLNGKPSTWTAVLSGVPQGSILGPILFNIFINDLDEGIIATILLKFADDTKMGQRISSLRDRDQLQQNLDLLCAWANRWGMRFNVGKCRIMHFGRSNPCHNYSMNGVDLEKTVEEKDLGVLITSTLKVGNQCERAVQTANGVLARILRTFTYRNKSVLPLIYRTYVRPHLEYAVPVWSPWQAGDIDKLENVQKRLVSAIGGLKGSTYEEKLGELGMETLQARRKRLDLTQAFKIIRQKEDVDPNTWFTHIRADRGANTRMAECGLNLIQGRSRLEIRRNFFSQRIAGQWNSLSTDTKMAKTVFEFRRKLRR